MSLANTISLYVTTGPLDYIRAPLRICLLYHNHPHCRRTCFLFVALVFHVLVIELSLFLFSVGLNICMFLQQLLSLAGPISKFRFRIPMSEACSIVQGRLLDDTNPHKSWARSGYSNFVISCHYSKTLRFSSCLSCAHFVFHGHCLHCPAITVSWLLIYFVVLPPGH